MNMTFAFNPDATYEVHGKGLGVFKTPVFFAQKENKDEPIKQFTGSL